MRSKALTWPDAACWERSQKRPLPESRASGGPARDSAGVRRRCAAHVRDHMPPRAQHGNGLTLMLDSTLTRGKRWGSGAMPHSRTQVRKGSRVGCRQRSGTKGRGVAGFAS